MWTPLQNKEKDLSDELLSWFLRIMDRIFGYFGCMPEKESHLRDFLRYEGRELLNIIVDIVVYELKPNKVDNRDELTEQVILWIIEMGGFHFEDEIDIEVEIPEDLPPQLRSLFITIAYEEHKLRYEVFENPGNRRESEQKIKKMKEKLANKEMIYGNREITAVCSYYLLSDE
jgi:hypothetical protein